MRNADGRRCGTCLGRIACYEKQWKGRRGLLANRPIQMYAVRTLRDRLCTAGIGGKMLPCQQSMRLLRPLWRLLSSECKGTQYGSREPVVPYWCHHTEVCGGTLFRVHYRRVALYRVRQMRERLYLVWQWLAVPSDSAGFMSAVQRMCHCQSVPLGRHSSRFERKCLATEGSCLVNSK